MNLESPPLVIDDLSCCPVCVDYSHRPRTPQYTRCAHRDPDHLYGGATALRHHYLQHSVIFPDESLAGTQLMFKCKSQPEQLAETSSLSNAPLFLFIFFFLAFLRAMSHLLFKLRKRDVELKEKLRGGKRREQLIKGISPEAPVFSTLSQAVPGVG